MSKNNIVLENIKEDIEDDAEFIFDEETVNKLLKSEEDIKMGRVRDAKEVMEEFRIRFGF